MASRLSQDFPLPVIFVDAATQKNEQAYDARAREWQAAMDANFGHRYLEKPAMIGLLPETLVSQDVLCIGVGSGDELPAILGRNPNKVVGIDVSTKLLEIAKSRFPQVEFLRMDMTQMLFGDHRFDFVYSSLTFHYAKDWDVLLAEVGRVLKKDRQLLFSTHHPIYWAGKAPTGNSYTNVRGITVTEHTAVLPGEVEVTYYNHANESSIVEALKHARFQLRTAFAPSVVPAALEGFGANDIAAYENLKAKNENTPLFFVVSAVKE